MRVLIVDNYDSFVYNLAQYIGEQGAETIVCRNDEVTLKEAVALKPDRIVLSQVLELLKMHAILAFARKYSSI